MNAEPQVWVVVISNEKGHPRWGPDEGGPLVMETYTRNATREEAQRRAGDLEKTYGACRIARLVYE